MFHSAYKIKTWPFYAQKYWVGLKALLKPWIIKQAEKKGIALQNDQILKVQQINRGQKSLLKHPEIQNLFWAIHTGKLQILAVLVITNRAPLQIIYFNAMIKQNKKINSGKNNKPAEFKQITHKFLYEFRLEKM